MMIYVTLSETNSSPLKNDGWEMSLSFWGPAYVQGRTVSFRESIIGSYAYQVVLDLGTINK